MSERLTPGEAVDAAVLDASFEQVELDQVVAGAPETRYIDLDVEEGRTVGVWEHTPGTSTDVEIDEVFVVLGGDATLEFLDPALPSVELYAGVIVRLAEGMHTRWTVRDTLRKVYIAT